MLASTSSEPEVSGPEALYLDLLKKCLTRLLFDRSEPGETNKVPTGFSSASVRKRLGPLYIALVRRAPFKAMLGKALDRIRRTVERRLPVDYGARYEGRDWPASAETMIGMKRLDNLQYCIGQVLRDGISGDLVETGVWRGGATIFMRGVLAAYGITDRKVFVADSFRGLPPPDVSKAPADKGDIHWTFGDLAIPLEEVKRNFKRYGLLDDQVVFLPGWFSETLPTAPIKQLAVMRLDGDMYESTMDALVALYDKLSPGGFAIIDDYGAIPACRTATEDFRTARGITEPLQQIDWTGVFWRKRTA
ncbi:MAG: macrocin O-methyltransferase [Candidatus Meridianibacter frigidus]|nr:MAG: macrocin O-methyltransferase [Candidatus Eremiobacteraeota bacterium]